MAVMDLRVGITIAGQVVPDSLRPLLVKEQDELHHWNRTACQTYFAWYTVFLTVNGVALMSPLGNGTTHANPRMQGYACVIFALWNLLGVVATFAVGYAAGHGNRRMTEINRLLMEGHDPSGTTLKSALPMRLLRIAYVANAIALLSLFVTWVLLWLK